MNARSLREIPIYTRRPSRVFSSLISAVSSVCTLFLCQVYVLCLWFVMANVCIRSGKSYSELKNNSVSFRYSHNFMIQSFGFRMLCSQQEISD